MRLEWSQFAIEDRDKILDYIEQENPKAAITVDDRIRDQVVGLVKFPETGRYGQIEGTRELVINRTSYIAAYRIVGDTVLILRVLHSSQLWPDEMPDEGSAS